MSIVIGIEIVIMLLAIAFCFFFAISEASLVAANPNLLKRLSTSGDRRAMTAFKLITNRKVLFGTILLGTNLAIVTFSTIGESLMGEHSSGILWLLLSILIWDVIILIFGEIIPKSWALEAPDRIALVISPAVTFIGRLMKPFIDIAHFIPSLFLRDGSSGNATGTLVTEQQIKLALIEGSQVGTVDEEGKDFGLRVMEFAETAAERVMTLRGDIIALEAEITVREAYDRILDHGFSRIPIYKDGDEEKIVGFLNVKDLIKAYVSNEQDKTLCELKRDITFIPEKKKTLDLLRDFQRERSHIAMVVDETGSITGLVTLEDLLEEVVGEIYDEHDEPEERIKKLGSDTFILDGRLEIDDFNHELNLELNDEEYETIGGFVMGLFGRVPNVGMSIQHSGMIFTVTSMDNRRIDQVKVKLDRNGASRI